jgi:hypothetical protein
MSLIYLDGHFEPKPLILLTATGSKEFMVDDAPQAPGAPG